MSEKSRRYYWEHKDEIAKRRKGRDKLYYLENRDIIRNKCREYSQTEAGKKSQQNRSRRKYPRWKWYYDFRGMIRYLFNCEVAEATTEMLQIVITKKLLKYESYFSREEKHNIIIGLRTKTKQGLIKIAEKIYDKSCWMSDSRAQTYKKVV